MTNERLINILINTFDWASEVSEQVFKDLIIASGITDNELNELGFDAIDVNKKERTIND